MRTQRLRALEALHLQLMGTEPPVDPMSLIKVRRDLRKWKRPERVCRIGKIWTTMARGINSEKG